MGEVCAARARALYADEDPELTFRPVARWLELEPATLVRVEYLVASARHAQAQGDESRSVAFLLSTRDLLRRIRAALAPKDKEALAVHPWSLLVTRGLDRGEDEDTLVEPPPRKGKRR